MNFTAIGDPVNTAARLQSVAKEGTVVISSDCYKEISDLSWEARFSCLSGFFPRITLIPLSADNTTMRQYFRVMDGRLSFKRFVRQILLRMPWLVLRSFLHGRKTI